MLNIPAIYSEMGKISNNLERHGEEDVTAFDVPFSGMTLGGEEVNALLDDPYADRALFSSKGNLREPALKGLKPFELADTFDGAVVVLEAMQQTYTFSDCKISKVTIEPRNGGDTMLSFTVRIRPEDDKAILFLLGHQNREVKIDVQDAKVALKGGRKQQELPLSRAGEGEQPEGDEPLTHPEQLFEKPKKTRAKKSNGEKRAH